MKITILTILLLATTFCFGQKKIERIKIDSVINMGAGNPSFTASQSYGLVTTPLNDTVKCNIEILRTGDNPYSFWILAYAVRHYEFQNWSDSMNAYSGYRPVISYYISKDKTRITDKVINAYPL